MDERTLARSGHASYHDEHAERDIDIDILQIVEIRVANLERSRWFADRFFQRCPVVQVTAGDGVAGLKTFDRAFEDDLAAAAACAWAEIDDMVGDRDGFRFVFHHQDGVALVAETEEEVVHALDVVWVETGGGFVEDVRDIGQGGAEVADDLGALGFATGEGAGRAIEREVAESDLHEGIEDLLQGGEKRRDRWIAETANPNGEIADLHRAGIGDVDALDFRGSRGVVESGAVALRAGGEGDRALDEGTDVRLHRLDILGEKGFLDFGDQSLVGEIDAVDLDLGRLLIEEVIEFSFGEVADGFVGVDKAGFDEDLDGPEAIDAVAGDGDGAIGDRFRVVIELGEIDIGDCAAAFAAGAHAAGTGEGGLHRLAACAAIDRDRAGRADRGDVEGEGVGRTNVRLAEAAEEDAENRVGVGGSADRRAGVGAHPLLIDDDRGGQPFEDIDFGARLGRHETLDEGAVGFVDEPL